MALNSFTLVVAILYHRFSFSPMSVSSLFHHSLHNGNMMMSSFYIQKYKKHHSMQYSLQVTNVT